ncbi:MAG: hypothetical protein K9K64_09305 [Desulfohalobiaceae bacterium]|nr:hypothetical protein [Desulfohalobiaceae bacterium]
MEQPLNSFPVLASQLRRDRLLDGKEMKATGTGIVGFRSEKNGDKIYRIFRIKKKISSLSETRRKSLYYRRQFALATGFLLLVKEQ